VRAKQPPPGTDGAGSRLCADDARGDDCCCEEDAADRVDKDAVLSGRALTRAFAHVLTDSDESNWCCGVGLLG
jgi:hypothetical protein